MNQRGIASAGNLIVDHVKIIDCYPVQGNLSNISEVSRSTGGATTNLLIDLAKIDPDIPLQAIGCIGDDESGEYVIKQLKHNNIDTGSIQIYTTLGTSFTDVMSVASTGERTFFHYRGANMKLSFDHFDFSMIKADILHIGYALLLDSMDSEDEQYGTIMAKTLAKAQESGIKTAIDVVSENSDRFSKIVPPSLKYTDYCVINEVEASMITGMQARNENGKIDIQSIENMCITLFDMGVGSWVAIHSPEAGYGLEKDGEFIIQPSIDVPREFIKSKVGAGDAFCAGILYSAYKGYNMKVALEIASSTAISSLSEPNSTDGMKSIDEVMKLFTQYPPMKF